MCVHVVTQEGKKDNTVLFFKYIILLQSYRYIHSIINNIYKNITFSDYKIKRELFTLKHLYKTLDIAGEVLGERLNIDVKFRWGSWGTVEVDTHAKLCH